MIDAIVGILRSVLAALGLLALADPAMTGSLVTVAALAFAVALLVVAAAAGTVHGRPRGPSVHPTRRIELTAPLAQSDPDAPGHVRRRGPGQVTAAA